MNRNKILIYAIVAILIVILLVVAYAIFSPQITKTAGGSTTTGSSNPGIVGAALTFLGL